MVVLKIMRCIGVDGDRPSLGLVEGDAVTGLHHPTGEPVRTLAEVMGWSDAVLLDHATGTTRPTAAVRAVAPYTELPRNMLCVGRNYAEHAREFSASGFDRTAPDGDEETAPPIIFTKPRTALIGPNDPIAVPEGLAGAFDYEAELAVVIGTGGRAIAPEDALRHVFGYTIVNDTTARDLQKAHRQWFLGKSLDTSCPTGPVIVTAEGFDHSDLRVRSWVNGELRQDSRTALMIHRIPDLVATISRGMQLLPGDLIATGTPAGVGIGFTPPRFLADGDLVKIAVEGIGEVENEFQIIPDDVAEAGALVGVPRHAGG